VSRDAGFAIGDRSTRTLYDVRLVRATRKVGLAAIVAWDAIVDASWEAGCRVQFDDAVDTLPYDLGTTTDVRMALAHEGLLDEEGLIREASWLGWFGTADKRRTAKREWDRTYAAVRRARVATDTRTVADESHTVASTDRSVRTDRQVRPSGRAPAREDHGFETVRETAAALGIGFHPAPKPVRAKR